MYGYIFSAAGMNISIGRVVACMHVSIGTVVACMHFTLWWSCACSAHFHGRVVTCMYIFCISIGKVEASMNLSNSKSLALYACIHWQSCGLYVFINWQSCDMYSMHISIDRLVAWAVSIYTLAELWHVCIYTLRGLPPVCIYLLAELWHELYGYI